MTRAFGEKALAGDDEIGGARKFAGLPFVDDEQVDPLQHAMQRFVRDGNPEIHRVRDDEGLLRGALVQQLQLVIGGHVGEHHDRRAGGGGGH